MRNRGADDGRASISVTSTTTMTTAWNVEARSREATGERLTVCHLFSGDLWAGAEVVIFNLLSCLDQDPALRVLALSLNEGVLTDRLRAAGITTLVIPEAQHRVGGILRRAARVLKDGDVTILHSHRYKENVLAAVLAKWLGMPELITTMHGLPEWPTDISREARRARWRARLDFLVLRRRFTSVVAVSHEMKRVLVGTYGFQDDQVQVILNGGRFPTPAAPHGPRNQPFHIGTVARMVPVKGLDLFLDVASALRRGPQPVRFSILGDGPLRDELARKVAALDLRECVEFMTPRPDPFGYYRSLDLYLNTSRHEGLPLSLVEAMACGTPIVSAAVGGIPEIVSHGEHGFLVEGRDPAVFAERCVTLMREDGLRTAMGERASAWAHSRLSAHAMADGYRRLYCSRAGTFRGDR
jgi:glycosyltransferase involved in cell wall biosynthesis